MHNQDTDLGNKMSATYGASIKLSGYCYSYVTTSFRGWNKLSTKIIRCGACSGASSKIIISLTCILGVGQPVAVQFRVKEAPSSTGIGSSLDTGQTNIMSGITALNNRMVSV